LEAWNNRKKVAVPPWGTPVPDGFYSSGSYNQTLQPNSPFNPNLGWADSAGNSMKIEEGTYTIPQDHCMHMQVLREVPGYITTNETEDFVPLADVDSYELDLWSESFFSAYIGLVVNQGEWLHSSWDLSIDEGTVRNAICQAINEENNLNGVYVKDLFGPVAPPIMLDSETGALGKLHFKIDHKMLTNKYLRWKNDPWIQWDDANPLKISQILVLYCQTPTSGGKTVSFRTVNTLKYSLIPRESLVAL
jgi:hypothetical protein